jgi:hypothetical protein
VVKISQKLPSVFGGHVRYIILTINSGMGFMILGGIYNFRVIFTILMVCFVKICLLLKEISDRSLHLVIMHSTSGFTLTLHFSVFFCWRIKFAIFLLFKKQGYQYKGKKKGFSILQSPKKTEILSESALGDAHQPGSIMKLRKKYLKFKIKAHNKVCT